MATMMLLSGGTLIASVAAYKYILGNVPLWGNPSDLLPVYDHPGGRMRARNEPWSHVWADIHPMVNSRGGHVSITPDLTRKNKRQVYLGGKILPRKRMS